MSSGLHEPAAKRAKVASPLQVIPTQSPKQSFAADDLQQCLFKTTNVRPVNKQQLLAKRQENTCFCKWEVYQLIDVIVFLNASLSTNVFFLAWSLFKIIPFTSMTNLVNYE